MPCVIKTIAGDNALYEVVLIKKKGCRRLILKFNPLKRIFQLTAPPRVTASQIERFLDKHHQGIELFARSIPAIIPLTHGQMIPIFGETHLITDGKITGDNNIPQFIVLATTSRCAGTTKRMLQSLLKQRIDEQINKLMQHEIFKELQITPRIYLRDPVSLWGSCGVDGSLMFSWRLVFAPLPVLDYVIAHECAHLIHRHHNKEFWQLVQQLDPMMKEAMGWLKQHGQSLFIYG